MTVFKYKNGQLVQVAGNSGGGSGSTTPPDAELSATSENAVQNKVVTNKFALLNDSCLGVPSNENWVDITIQSDKFYYTAPANGYIRWVGSVSTNTGFAQILNIGRNTALIIRDNIKCGGSSFNYSASGDAECITCPCKTGDNIYIHLYYTSNETLKFIPAEEI
jgi:hypothetical protein